MMELVAQTGIDVPPWSITKGGKPVADPASNPAYCYEWSFEDRERVAFGLWFEKMLVDDGRVVQRVNMRDLQRSIERAAHLEAGRRAAISKRAVRFDIAAQNAFRSKLPVRVIVCDGDRINLSDTSTTEPSKVELRLLDPSPRRVTEYVDVGSNAGAARRRQRFGHGRTLHASDGDMLPRHK